MGRKKGRSLIVCWTEEMRFIGVFLNITHAAETLPEINTNTAKVAISDYLRGERIDCYEHVFVRYELGKEPINTFDIREKTRPEASRKLKLIQVKRRFENGDVDNLTQKELDILYKHLSD